MRDSEITGEVSSALLSMIAAGHATNRADLARSLSVPPSTITSKVNELLDAGLVEEIGSGAPTGGRRPRILQLRSDAGVVLAADLGRNHAHLAVLSLSGAILSSGTIRIEIGAGPAVVLPEVSAAWRDLLSTVDAGLLRGVGICLPGPVDVARGMVESPASMPGWHHFRVAEWLTDQFGVVAVVDNDANMMALGEYSLLARRNAEDATRYASMLFLKAGTAIGCGMVFSGRVYRGASFIAGDIAHVRVSAAQELPCACGNRGCLETVAGGAGIGAELRRSGIEVDDIFDIVRLAHDSDAMATTQTRSAGRLVGETLSAIVNFLNPDIVVIGGVLSTVEPFVAAVRSQLYESCHPLATKTLKITQSEAGADAGVIGVAQLSIRKLLAQL